jgi:Tfp pilus assembly protein PilN
MAMRPISIDFSRDSEAPSATGVTLLRLGLAAAVVSAACYVTVSGEIDRLEARAGDTRSAAARRMPERLTESPGDAREMQQEIRNANQVVQQMTLPWDRLFKELETAASKEIALLSVQPDVSSRQVRISGEAKDFKAMLDYARRLKQTDMLRDVILLGHEVKAQDPQRPVAFTLAAGWSERP